MIRLAAARQTGKEGTHGPLEERRLQLELLEVLGLHRPELRQSRLNRVDGALTGKANEKEQDPEGENAAEDDRKGHLRPRYLRCAGSP